MILAVRDVEDTEDGRLYPIPATGQGDWLIKREPLDGEHPVLLPITGVTEDEVVTDRADKKVTRVVGVKGTLYLTECRLVIAIEKYDTGAQRGNTSTAALVSNKLERMQGARRTSGTILVGQVRYQWLKFVVARNRTGLLGTALLRIGCEARTVQGETRLYRIDVGTGNQLKPLEAAGEMVRSAAAFKIRYFPGDPANHARLRELTKQPALPVPQPPNKASVLNLPNYFYVAASNAYPVASSTEPDEGLTVV